MNHDRSLVVLQGYAARAKPIFIMTGALVFPCLIGAIGLLLKGLLGLAIAVFIGLALGSLVGWFVGEAVELHFRGLAEILSRLGARCNPTTDADK